jgi:hypothetical protein
MHLLPSHNSRRDLIGKADPHVITRFGTASEVETQIASQFLRMGLEFLHRTRSFISITQAYYQQ